MSLISGVGKTEGEENMSDNLDSDPIKDSADKTEIFVCMLKACANEKDLHKGNKIHSNIVRSGYVFIASSFQLVPQQMWL